MSAPVTRPPVRAYAPRPCVVRVTLTTKSSQMIPTTTSAGLDVYDPCLRTEVVLYT